MKTFLNILSVVKSGSNGSASALGGGERRLSFNQGFDDENVSTLKIIELSRTPLKYSNG
jgi:hypothetical protein